MPKGCCCGFREWGASEPALAAHRREPDVAEVGEVADRAPAEFIRRYWCMDVFGTQNLAAFIAASILLSVTPGQDTFYILGQSIARGRRAGVLSALGIASGALVHVGGAAVGFSALLASSAYAFTVVKWAGAGYLVFLGVQMLRDNTAPERELARHGGGSSAGIAIYTKGALTNVLNPKVALFFLAFLP